MLTSPSVANGSVLAMVTVVVMVADPSGWRSTWWSKVRFSPRPFLAENSNSPSAKKSPVKAGMARSLFELALEVGVEVDPVLQVGGGDPLAVGGNVDGSQHGQDAAHERRCH